MLPPESQTTQPTASDFTEIRSVVEVIEDKKGEAVRILDVRGKSTITDYLILATATSEPHIKALKAAVEGRLKEDGVRVRGEDREVGSGWIVVDVFDFMVHLQTREMRDFYSLDKLWKDADEVQL
ncbi:MAG: ribosome silencing factor [Opitutales bacterium]